MAIDPRRLLVLDAIASAGGVTAAGRVLHISPSAVSQHLAGLEREAGVALVDRTAGGVRLTPAGRALARRAAEVKDVLLAADNDLAAVTGRLSGVVKVAAYASIASRIVAPAMAALAVSHPGLGVTIHIEAEEQALLHRLTSGSADVAIIEQLVSPQPDPRPHPVDEGAPAGTVGRAVLDDPYRIVVPAAWAGQPVAGLLERPWVGGPADSSVRVALTRIGAAAGRTPHVPHECCEFGGALDLVAAGLGAAVVPQLALGSPPAGVVVTGLPDAGRRRLHAIRPGRPTRPRNTVLLLIEALRAAAAEDRSPPP
jgi:DNA-binding transcriptional LysR family regulator